LELSSTRPGKARKRRVRGPVVFVPIHPVRSLKDHNVHPFAHFLLFLLLFICFLWMLRAGNLPISDSKKSVTNRIDEEKMDWIVFSPSPDIHIPKPEVELRNTRPVRLRKTKKADAASSPLKVEAPAILGNEADAPSVFALDSVQTNQNEDSALARGKESIEALLRPSLDFMAKQGFKEWGQVKPKSDSEKKAFLMDNFYESYWSQVEKYDNYEEFKKQVLLNNGMPLQDGLQINVSELIRMFKSKKKPKRGRN